MEAHTKAKHLFFVFDWAHTCSLVVSIHMIVQSILCLDKLVTQGTEVAPGGHVLSLHMISSRRFVQTTFPTLLTGITTGYIFDYELGKLQIKVNNISIYENLAMVLYIVFAYNIEWTRWSRTLYLMSKLSEKFGQHFQYGLTLQKYIIKTYVDPVWTSNSESPQYMQLPLQTIT